ncbi:TonB-dependent receptor plug domain-containing protein [Hyphomonas chukchiensis]|nr:TonB-dependent receptor [Hyphomonas chukchiensis]
MNGNTMKSRLLASSVFAGVALMASASMLANAQEADDAVDTVSAPAADESVARQATVYVTGTRIQSPGIVSSSPIATVGREDLEVAQTVEVERLFKDLPITVPGDGQNTNNGTAGATTVNLRALGTQRSLILVDGKRMTPFDVNGQVDVSAIPVNMLERVDVVTGGASAVYGSDAMAGAINFITRQDFAGVEVDSKYTVTEEGDGQIYDIATLFGANFDGGRGNVTVSMGHTDRKAVLLGDRELGLFGIATANGPNEGGAPASPEANCDNPDTTAFDTGVGSTTTIPTTLDLTGGSLQIRNDGTLGPRCSRFNFNPFNYYQTPQQRYNAFTTARYDITENIEAYARASFSSINVTQQVAPSGVFGNVFEVPLQNPFLSDAARTAILGQINTFLAANPAVGFDDVGVNDLNNNGIFDDQDSISTPIRRRTTELGPRSTSYDSNTFQILTGIRGDLDNGWNYDISFAHGESDRTNTSAGYTNVANIATALNTISADTCTTPGGSTTDGCVPLDLFSTGFGSITPAMAGYSSATALEKRNYTQNIASASISGPVEMLTSPFADSPLQFALGTEYREESGSTTPDECLKLAPTSCLGGAGGNLLPVSSSFDVIELFAETIVPLISGKQLAEDVSLELGGRISDYSSVGQNETWKAGINWALTDSFRVRVMQQKAVRAPNIGELGSPITTGLGDASFDPCSDGNPNPIDADLAALCVATGVNPALVGVVGDIVSGQINQFQGSDPDALPDAETADTFTAGFVYQPAFDMGPLLGTTISLDYYDIEISDYIGSFAPQEVLDQCYNAGDLNECAKINRIGGSLATAGSGVDTYTTNLDYIRTEGVDLVASTGLDFDQYGALNFSFYGSFLMTQESLSSSASPVIDCLGKFGNDCYPTPEFRFQQRSTWSMGPASLSLNWRHLGEVEIQDSQKANTFDGFEKIKAQNYFDLTGSYQINDMVGLTVGVRNLFEEDLPVVGNEAGSTDANSGNTFPSTYDVFGRTYTIGLKATF